MAIRIQIMTLITALYLSMIVCYAQVRGGFPAMFVFGDSAIDPGNNNNLFTLAKANFYPNGIDFPGGPTGRFCNGFTLADYLANLLGLPIIPAFNNENTKGENILKGVNYASGGAGVLSFANPYLGDKFTMDKQVENFQRTAEDLRSELVKTGLTDADKFLADSLILVIASNDLLTYETLSSGVRSNLFNTSGERSVLFNTVDDYIDLIIKTFRGQLEKLYDIGARRFLVNGVGPIGCIPFMGPKTEGDGKACWDFPNVMATKYNEKLQPLLLQLNNELPGSNFGYGDAYNFALNILNNPSQYGFKNENKPCCGFQEDGRGKSQCLPLTPTGCTNRSEFFFWDSYHPTSAVNQIAATQELLPLALSLLDST